ncbi:hypothetical protein [Mucilaginibacter sp.]|jgi:hypothetical protein|uniref:hypothetical protein n=1 Tax=Mucilaginibacter sp. TaxID=1882438 RepID=UPI0035637F1E
MADTILYARVKQKKATEAVWLANPLILLDGEVAYVVDPVDPAVVTNYKIGVGDKTFAELPYVIHYAVDATYQPVKRFIGVSTNQVITGLFKYGTELNKILFFNTAAVSLTIRVGTTPGDADLGEFIFSNSARVLDIAYLFESTETVYISGITGLCSFFVNYTPYNDTPAIPPEGATAVFRYPKGHFGYFYNLYAGHLEENFDTSTGAGLAGTSFENCALTGTGDLVDFTDAYVVGINAGGDPQSLTGNTNNTITLVTNNLPPIPFVEGLDSKAGSAGIFVKSNVNPGPRGSMITQLGGISAPINTQPKSIKMYSFVAIAD